MRRGGSRSSGALVVEPEELPTSGLEAADQDLRQALHQLEAKLMIPLTGDEQMCSIERNGPRRFRGPGPKMPDVRREQPGPAQNIFRSKLLDDQISVCLQRG